MAKRKGRDAKYDNLGEVGRLTGAPMPKNVPLTEDGVEDYEAFFSPPQATKAARSAKKQRPNEDESQRRGQRPDKAHELGQVGRKTGVRMRENVPKNALGAEDIDAFFRSPTNTVASVNVTSARTVRAGSSGRRRQSSVGVGRRESPKTRRQTDYGLEQSFDDGDDMDVDEDFGLSPRSYIRSQQMVNITDILSPGKTGQTSVNKSQQLELSPAPNAKNSRPSTVVDIPDSSDESDDQEQSQIAEQLTPPRAAKSAAKTKAIKISPINNHLSDDEDVGDVPDLSNGPDTLDFGQDHFDAGGMPDERPPTRSPSPDANLQEEQENQEPTTKRKSTRTAKKAKIVKGKGKAKEVALSPPARDEPHSPPKKGKGKAKKAEQSSQQSAGPSKITVPRQKRKRDESVDAEGLRRSEREVIPVLEHWRNERIVYNRRQSGPQPCYGIKDIVRYEPEELPHWAQSKKKRARTTKTAANNKRRLKAIDEDEEEGALDDYTGWDDTTDPEAIVYDYVRNEETKRRIAFPASMITTKPAGKQNYRFQKIFSEGDYLAGGILEIPVNEKKPLKPARDNSYILFCHHGAVRVLVYRSSFTIATGGFFMVPRGNSYEIENIGHTDAQIVFLQARELKVIEEADAEELGDETAASS